MDAGPARRRSAGFSLVELLLTLAALGLVAWLVLRIVDRGTRMRGETEAPPSPDAVLRTAFRTLQKDVRAAASGGLPLSDAIRPVADQTSDAGPAAYPIAGGAAPVAVRPGTDQLGLRGALRSPLVSLDARVSGTGESVSERMRAGPAEVRLRAPASAGLDAVRRRLSEAGAGRTLFFVRDTDARWAVGRVASVAPRGEDGALDLVVDFADPEATTRNRGGDPGAAARLGDVSHGGVFDDVVWFVARGLEGRAPDFVPGTDPDSLRFPHPFLAVAARTGADRWEVHGAGEEVEDMQVAWGLSSAPGALEWRAEAPGGTAPSPAELADPAGGSRLRSLRIALAARAAPRLARSPGAPAPEFAVPMNGPSPGSVSGAAPIGWDSSPERRVRFDREVREERVDLVPAASTAR